MNIHELKELSFDEAIDLLETRLTDMQAAIDDARQKIDNGEYHDNREAAEARYDALLQDRAAIVEKMEKLRQQKAAELAGETDNLLTELLQLFDQLGEKIDAVLG